MALKRVILEMGTGNDLHGGDYTKAAVRAVEDAIHHSSLSMIRTLGIDTRKQMKVDVTIGVQKPDKVDLAKVKAARCQAEGSSCCQRLVSSINRVNVLGRRSGQALPA